jgi:hypothetical protein
MVRDMSAAPSYLDFVRAKAVKAPELGLPVAAGAVNAILHRHQPVLVKWLVEGGRRALFANFGLGKTMIQLEAMRLIREATGGICLVIIPLTVVTEFKRDAEKLGIDVRFVRTTAEILADGAPPLPNPSPPRGEGHVRPIYLTNYESVREGKIDTSILTAVSLDEASCLRGFGGTKTFREFMAILAGDDRRPSTGSGRAAPEGGIPYRFVATATPSPNEYIELLAYAAFLGIMDVGEAKTRFFKRNSEKADQLTLHAHKEDEFWLWVNSWAAFIQRPSDLGFSDEGYDLPPLDVRWHEVPSDHRTAGAEADGQGRLLKAEAIGIVDASREKRASLGARIDTMLALRAEDPGAHRIIWHDLEDERRAIEAAAPNVVSIYGAQALDDRYRAIIGFSDGEIGELAAKPVLAGSGCNFQRHCAWAIYLGIGFKFNDFYQSLHRLQRFQQTRQVRIDLIYTEAERGVREALLGKWKRHEEMCARMSEIIRTFGLGLGGAETALARTISDGSAARVEVSDLPAAAADPSPQPLSHKGRGANEPCWRVVNDDTVIETGRMAADSVGLIVTSIPFATQYEYTPSFNDFGHTDDAAHFFRQMDFLSPELLRVLAPGRMLCVHVKDRTRPGGMEGVGFQTVDPFHADTIQHYRRHGFYYMGMITVETDVVRENNQTYRLGWSEKCKDGTRMSVGMPEYVLLFRKAPSDSSNGYADCPVEKAKADYTRARWQTDAHAKWRSAGNRLLEPAELVGLPARDIYRAWRGHATSQPYDYEGHVAIAQALEDAKSLPPGFALLPPHAWHPDVWSDVARMRTLNGVQQAKGREMHLCPLQFDIVDRLIRMFSSEGDLVYDPFGGLMTVPIRAVKMGRRGAAAELNPDYFADGVRLLREADRDRAVPDLFGLLASESGTFGREEDDAPPELEATE